MVCGGCGATIADKAIVCYRCGTPTAIPTAPRREGGVKATPAIWTPLVLVVVAIAAGWLASTAPSHSWTQIVAIAVAVVAGLSGVYLIARTPR